VVEQIDPQLRPAGELVMVPVPLPDLVIVNGTSVAAKFAVTVLAFFTFNRQVDSAPRQAPDQPTNVDPGSGKAVSVTLAFFLKRK
jgi:hypothetical protein